MKLETPPRLKTLIPTTSMGDIAFLLIIFFMLTSNFIKEAHVQVNFASSEDIEKLEESVISVSIDKDAKVWLQGEECELAGLQGAVAEIVERMPEQVVMVKVDKDVPHKTYGEVMLALSKANVEIALVGNRQE